MIIVYVLKDIHLQILVVVVPLHSRCKQVLPLHHSSVVAASHHSSESVVCFVFLSCNLLLLTRPRI